MYTRLVAGSALLFAFGTVMTTLPHRVARAAGLPSTPISSIALITSDLPSGFTRTLARVVTNSQADRTANAPAGTFARSGRLTGYQERFERKASAGLTEVLDYVALYSTVARAHLDLSITIQKAEHGGLPPGYQRTSASGLGNEGSAFPYRLDAHASGVAIYFRRGRYTTQIIGDGIGSGFHPTQVLSLAHIVDHRMMQARP